MVSRLMTIDKAVSYTMPFGKYKGMLLLDISQNDVPYIEWVAANVDGKLGEAAKLITEDIKWRRKVGWSPRRTR